MRDRIKQMYKQLGLGLLNFVIVLALPFAAQAVLRRRVPDLVGVTILAALVLAAYFAGSRWIEHRKPIEFDASRAMPETAAGIALGIALFSIIMGLLGAFGAYHFTGRAAVTSLVSGFLVALLVGIFEETITRGFLFRLIQLAGGTWIAIVISSALFGAAHAFNPSATLTSSVAIALEAGVLLAAAFIVTGRLWLPIGIHAGWNFAEGPLFGMAVSGGHVKSSLLTGTLTGPVFLTGGGFGPEASVVAIVVCLAAGAIFLWRAARSGLLIRPPWNRPDVN